MEPTSNPQPQFTKPAIFTLKQLRLLDLPQPMPIVEGFLNEGETVLLAGKPKAGKSRLLQQLALAITRGQPFLGMPVPRPRRVLYIDLENHLTGAKRRFTAMSNASDEADGRLFIVAPSTLSGTAISATKEGIERLGRWLDLTNADVLIIDPWRLFMEGKENDAQDVVRGLRQLSKVREKRPSLGVMICHHLRKSSGQADAIVRLQDDPAAWIENVSGHHALSAHCDTTMGLERTVGGLGEESIVLGGVGRNFTSPILRLEEDLDSLTFQVASGDDALRSVMSIGEWAIYEKLRSEKRLTFTDAMRVSGSKNRKAVTAVLKKAVDHAAMRHEGTFYIVGQG